MLFKTRLLFFINRPRACYLRIMTMSQGKVKWFNTAKGFGFIQPDEGGADVFVHISALERANLNHLKDGQPIAYELATQKGKTSAVNLKLLEG
jgi:cold shock protein